MEPIVSIIMGSTSDLPVMEKAAKLLDEMHVPFEMNALSAHRTPEAVEEFAKNAAGRGIKVIIAAAGMAAALPGVIAANTTLPVIKKDIPIMFRSAILQNMKITRFFRCTVHLLSRISSEKIKISIPSTLSLREEEITYRLLTTVRQRDVHKTDA